VVGEIPREGAPLDFDLKGGAIFEQMLADLKRSVRAHEGLAHHRLEIEPDALMAQLDEELAAVQLARGHMEYTFWGWMQLEPEKTAGYREEIQCVRSKRACGVIEQASLRDMAAIALDPGHVQHLNPFVGLSAHSVELVREHAVAWLESCSLEDRLLRVKNLVKVRLETTSPDGQRALDSKIIAEVRNEREWSTSEHPWWLVFEVDQQIQVRTKQYRVAKALLKALLEGRSGAVAQLNMGEGKTRVINPLLILENYFGKERQPVQLLFLDQLIGEGYAYLHDALTAGVMNVPISVLAFRRDVALTIDLAQRIQNTVERAALHKSVLVMTPESRLSLENRIIELQKAEDTEISRVLWSALSVPALTVLDEVDVMTSVKLQLVYGLGEQLDLPHLQERVGAIKALLFALKGQQDSLLADGKLWSLRESAEPGSFFSDLHLLEQSSDCVSRLGLLENVQRGYLPLPMSWLRERSPSKLAELVSDPNFDPKEAGEEFAKDLEDPSRQAQLMAFRGMVAFGILPGCLSLRHQVKYGLAPMTRVRPKEVAVPYSACDTPTLRSEYSQPDVALLLTCLAYLFTGLTRAQFRASLERLVMLPPLVKESEYNRWFELSRDRLGERASTIDCVDKIDMSNAEQFDLLFKAFHKNMHAVFFHLLQIVFPRDTKQFSHRVRGTAWNFEPFGKTLGFSGTKDQHHQMPEPFELMDAPNKELLATDGKMAHLLRDYSEEVLERPVAGWEDLIEECVERGMSALIDVGALLSGAKLEDVARKYLTHPKVGKKEYVQFFAKHDGVFGEWFVMKAGTLHAQKRTELAVSDSECFVIFDENNCRGTDKKLSLDAKALLTVGVDVGKDKLMQGAGRLRQFGQNQRIAIMGTQHALDGMKEVGGEVSPRSLILWVLKTSAEQSERSTLQWLKSAKHHKCRTREFRKGMERAGTGLFKIMEEEESFGATQLYGGTIERMQLRAYTARLFVEYEADSLVDRVRARVEDVGEQEVVLSNQSSDECERELEQEKEKEEEEEIETASASERAQTPWKSLSMRAIEDMLCTTPCLSAQAVADALVGEGAFSWGGIRVHITENAIAKVERPLAEGMPCLPKNPFLVIFQGASADMVVVSRFEADDLLRGARDGSLVSPGYRLEQLSSLLNCTDATMRMGEEETKEESPAAALAAGASTARVLLDQSKDCELFGARRTARERTPEFDQAICVIALLSGNAMGPATDTGRPPARVESLTALLPTKETRQLVLDLLRKHNQPHLIEGSFLQRLSLTSPDEDRTLFSQ